MIVLTKYSNMDRFNMDLRSDTVTQPTPGMLEAMMNASVGDDVFDEDPTVKALETKVAHLFNKDAGIFCPSGTMTNQIGVKVNTNPQDQVICDKRSHVYHYEGGGLAFNSLVSVRLLDGDRGRISASEVAANINPDNIHFPVSKLVLLENTINRAGGSYYTLPQVNEIAAVATSHNLKMHLDGARLFNALAVTNESTTEWGQLFNTISICLSKGLGAPVGSVLVGDVETIQSAKRVRKVLGGAMRQAGYLAAAGIYALDHHMESLAKDNQRAQQLGQILASLSFVRSLYPVDTNIVIFELHDTIVPQDFLKQLESKGIRALSFGGQLIRLVTHREITDEMIDLFEQITKGLYRDV
jgi:threonine aldolase